MNPCDPQREWTVTKLLRAVCLSPHLCHSEGETGGPAAMGQRYEKHTTA